jgi:2-polyprenyl-6-methoxyphenol hydroxylase-like FAD-dependent oxidoreductase
LTDFDVLIAGAGPAGCATAISLGRFAPKLRVGLIGAAPSGARIGETVPPQIKPLLDHLGLWPAFAAEEHAPSYRTLSAWGGPALLSNEFLFHTQQVGWRLDRARFDAMMLRGATRAEHIAGKVTKIEPQNDAWRVRLDDGAIHTARAVVDATGRAAALARLNGLRAKRFDRLVACFVFCDNQSGDGDLTIEAVRDGWWYAAALPDQRRVVAFMSDADIVRRLRMGERERFMRALGEAGHIRAAAGCADPIGSPQFAGAGSQLVTCDAAQTFVCTGDAASCFDPVSGQGIVKALRSGVFASYALADWVERGDGAGLRRYAAFVASEFAAYRDTLRDYYTQEGRWPDSLFWKRRRAEAATRRHDTRAPAQLAAVAL